MNSETITKNIHDINLSYLLLAKQLINHDRTAASFRLGMSDATIDLLKKLSVSQLMKLAETNQLLCQFRLDDEALIECITKDSRIDDLQQIHTGILLSSHLLDSLNEQGRA